MASPPDIPEDNSTDMPAANSQQAQQANRPESSGSSLPIRTKNPEATSDLPEPAGPIEDSAAGSPKKRPASVDESTGSPRKKRATPSEDPSDVWSERVEFPHLPPISARDTPDIEQISLSLSVEIGGIVSANLLNKQRRAEEAAAIRARCVENWEGHTPHNYTHERLAPFHICLSPTFADHVRDVHALLDRALVDIIERWFDDTEANFPSLMPLEGSENLFLWSLWGPAAKASGHARPFKTTYGLWRTDYLIEGEVRGRNQIKICEINSRLPFNGIWMIGSQNQAYEKDICLEGPGPFSFPDDFEKTQSVILDCFDKSKSLFIIAKDWNIIDSRALKTAWTKHTKTNAYEMAPGHIHMATSPVSPVAERLWWPGPNVDIHQCTLELFQHELAQMDTKVLRKLAENSVNDLRNIYLVHDKRMLGIVRGQIEKLVARKVLTEQEGTRLRNSIAETMLPGTDALQELLDLSIADFEEKNKWIVKPVRDAMGNGIKLGSDMTQEEWLETLGLQCSGFLKPSEGAAVIQRLAKHVWFDIERHLDTLTTDAHMSEHTKWLVQRRELLDKSEAEKFHLIGSHHFVNGQYDMFGPWRIGQQLHAGIGPAGQGIIMGTVLRQPDKPDEAAVAAECQDRMRRKKSGTF